jgi:hypothetical protein
LFPGGIAFRYGFADSQQKYNGPKTQKPQSVALRHQACTMTRADNQTHQNNTNGIPVCLCGFDVPLFRQTLQRRPDFIPPKGFWSVAPSL